MTAGQIALIIIAVAVLLLVLFINIFGSIDTNFGGHYA